MSTDNVQTFESQIEYEHFSRLLYATTKQPEYRAIIGSLPCFLLYRLRWFLYQFWAKKTMPTIATFEWQGEVIGGIMVGKSGEIGNPVITQDRILQVKAIKLISQWIDNLLEDKSKRFFIRTFESNESIITAAKRRGFVLSDKREYVMILNLGILNLVWYSSTPKSFISALVKVHPMLMLERLANQ